MSSTSRDCDRPILRAARSLAPLVALVASLTGCMLPPAADYVAVENVWPRLDSLYPDPTAGLVTQGPNCDPINFQARVVDPDEGETVRWRVFIDYQDGVGKQLSEGEAPSQPSPRIQFTIDENTPWVAGDTPHVVELFVTDREFLGEAGRSVDTTDGGGWVDLFWTVQLAECTPL